MGPTTANTTMYYPDHRVCRKGLSMLEMLACVAILGVLVALVVPRLHSGAKDCKAEACRVHQRTIEIQALLWKRQQGGWPASNLSDLGSSPTYFPEGLPVCPVDESAYTLNSNGRIIGHSH
jgi:prepilin-type N-terminal cleavage/methylation domain-containing protein